MANDKGTNDLNERQKALSDALARNPEDAFPQTVGRGWQTMQFTHAPQKLTEFLRGIAEGTVEPDASRLPEPEAHVLARSSGNIPARAEDGALIAEITIRHLQTEERLNGASILATLPADERERIIDAHERWKLIDTFSARAVENALAQDEWNITPKQLFEHILKSFNEEADRIEAEVKATLESTGYTEPEILLLQVEERKLLEHLPAIKIEQPEERDLETIDDIDQRRGKKKATRKRKPMTLEEFLGQTLRAEDIRRYTSFYEALREWLGPELMAPKTLRNELRSFALDYKVEGDVSSLSSHDGLKFVSRNTENPHAFLIKNDGVYFDGDVSTQDPLMLAKNMVLLAYTKGELSEGPVELTGSAEMQFYMLKMIEHINAQIPEKQRIQVQGADQIEAEADNDMKAQWGVFIQANGMQPERPELLKESPEQSALESYLLNEDTKQLLSGEKLDAVRENLVAAAHWIVENQSGDQSELAKALKITTQEAKEIRKILASAGLLEKVQIDASRTGHKILIDRDFNPVDFSNRNTIFLAAAFNKVNMTEQYPEFSSYEGENRIEFHKGKWEMVKTFADHAFGQKPKSEAEKKPSHSGKPEAAPQGQREATMEARPS